MKKGARIIAILFSSVIIFLTLIYAGNFYDSIASDFNFGTYTNTLHNGSAVVLSGANLSGNFTSRIFDAGANSVWNNLVWNGEELEKELFFAVDNSADVWKSSNFGINWSLIKDDYNNGDGNGITDMTKNSSGSLFVLYNQDVWNSNDGISWTKINDDYNGAEGQNGYVLGSDKNNNLFIIEGDQDVWKSSNSGTTWTKVSTDFNGANGNIFGIAVNDSSVIFAVDTQADVWKSSNSGTTWSLVKDDYNGAIGNHAIDLIADNSGNLFILDAQDVWKSSNSGATWSLANDNFNGADSNDGWVIYSDRNNFIFIVDGSEDVYKSENSGTNFSLLVSNLNGGSLGVVGLTSLIKNSSLIFQVRNCSLIDCSDGNWQNVNLSNMNSTGRYFQYKSLFTRTDSSINLQLNSVSINYSLINSAPIISIVSPQADEVYGYNSSVALNFSVSDAENNLDSCWYNFDNGNNFSIFNCQNATFNISEGNHILNLFANDSFGIVGNKSVNFSVDLNEIEISIVQPSGTQTSLSGIPLSYSITGNNLTCWYNLNNGNNISILNCQNSSFDVSSDGDYFLNFYANDSSGNLANKSSSFSVSTSSGGNTGGGGGRRRATTTEKNETIELNVSEIENVVENIGEEKKIDFQFENAERISRNQIRVSYILKELSGINQDVVIQFSLFDFSDKNVAEYQDEKKILANASENFESIININESLAGEFNLVVDLNSEKSSSSFKENFILGAPTGFAILGEGASNKLIFYFLIFLAVLFAFLIVRRILIYRKSLKAKKSFKKSKNKK